jgi:hypothetical protein
MPAQPPKKVPVMMNGDSWSQNHMERRAPAKLPWYLTQATLRREQFGNGQHDMEVQFTKAITGITRTFAQRRRNCDMHVG